MTGSVDDPADGVAVAGSIFTAVAVYAVRHALLFPNTLSPLGRYSLLENLPGHTC